MSAIIPKTDAKRFEEPPLSWHPGWARDHPIAIFTCPGGSTGSLHDWTVDDDGTVTPSVDCRCGCGFHEFIQLEDWNPDWLPRRADSQEPRKDLDR